MSAVCRHQRSKGQTGGGDSSSGAIYMVKVCRNLCPVARVPVARCNDANLTNIVFFTYERDATVFPRLWHVSDVLPDDVVDIHSQATHAVEKTHQRPDVHHLDAICEGPLFPRRHADCRRRCQ